MLHLSDIKKYERCPRAFQLSKLIQKDYFPFVHDQEDFNQLVIERLRLRDVFIGEKNQEVEISLRAWQTHEAIMNARFSYRDLRVTIPLLIHENGIVTLYMMYRSCYPKEKEAQKISDLLFVLEKNNIVVHEVYAMYLNAEYTRGEYLDVDQLLCISECLFNSKNKANKRIMDLIPQYRRDLDAMITSVHEVESMDLFPAKRSFACTRGIKCPYYDDCFSQAMSDDSILHLIGSQHKYAMLDEGIHLLKEADLNRIEGTRQQYAQILASRNESGCYIDRNVLKIWLENFKYPLAYLDFEWDTHAIPPYEGMKPYDVLTFQYSLHIEQQENSLSHYGYIGKDDCREEFIQSLLSHIPSEGSIVVFNMEGAEKLRLLQLAQQFPQYETQLQSICDRMIDLSLPFSSGTYYDIKMCGGYSLKTLVPIFSNKDYHDLDISHGMEAVREWRKYCVSDNEEEQTLLYQQLNEYCSLDTYAEYIVYHALVDCVK